MRIPILPLSVLLGLLLCPVASAETDRPTEIPFELVHNEILVFARLNGKGPFLMKVDTGVDPSTVDIHTALNLGLTVNPSGEEGAADEGTVYDTRFSSVELQNISGRDIDAYAGGMVSKIAKRLERPVVGVLGHNFFAGRIVQLDYPKRRLRFLADAPAGGPAPGRRAVMGFKDDENVIVDDVSIDGRRLKAALDVGSGASLAVSAEAASRLGLEKDLARGSVATLSVGAISAESVALQPAAGHEKKPWDAGVGNGFLKDYVLTIDFPDLKIFLEKP